MDEAIEHRRSRLRAWVAAQGGQAEVVRKYHLTKPQRSYLSQCLGEYAFREKAARNWERRFKLPPGHFDALGESPAKYGVAHLLSLSLYSMPPQKSWEDVMQRSVPDVFSCAMPDDALATTPQGTVLLCSKTIKPAIGDGVIVGDKAGGHYVRRYTQGPNGTWLAQADAPGYATLSSADGITLVAVVFGVLRGKV